LDWGTNWDGKYILTNGIKVNRNSTGISINGSKPKTEHLFKKGQKINNITLKNDLRINLKMTPDELETALSRVSETASRTIVGQWNSGGSTSKVMVSKSSTKNSTVSTDPFADFFTFFK